MKLKNHEEYLRKLDVVDGLHGIVAARPRIVEWLSKVRFPVNNRKNSPVDPFAVLGSVKPGLYRKLCFHPFPDFSQATGK